MDKNLSRKTEPLGYSQDTDPIELQRQGLRRLRGDDPNPEDFITPEAFYLLAQYYDTTLAQLQNAQNDNRDLRNSKEELLQEREELRIKEARLEEQNKTLQNQAKASWNNGRRCSYLRLN